jgi:hypothetical protein
VLAYPSRYAELANTKALRPPPRPTGCVPLCRIAKADRRSAAPKTAPKETAQAGFKSAGRTARGASAAFDQHWRTAAWGATTPIATTTSRKAASAFRATRETALTLKEPAPSDNKSALRTGNGAPAQSNLRKVIPARSLGTTRTVMDFPIQAACAPTVNRRCVVLLPKSGFVDSA